MNKWLAICMFLFLIVSLASCTLPRDSSPVLVERIDSSGVEVITVLGLPPDTVPLDAPDLRIGSTGAGGTEELIFERISDLVLLPGGRFTVIDNRGARVAVFDSTGSWLYDVGRRGGGPGEYTAPIRANVHGDTLFVWDARQRRLSRYSLDGVFLGGLVLSQRRTHRFAAVEDGYVLETESGQLADPEPARGALTWNGRDGEMIDTLVGPYEVPETGWTITNQETGAGHMINPPALAVYPRWALGRGRFFWLNPTDATVNVHNLKTGNLESILRLPYNVTRPTPSAQDAYFRALQAQLGLTDEAMTRERRGTTFADLQPAVAALVMDEPGRIWVARHDPTAIGRYYIGPGWDVFDIELRHVTHVRFPKGFELMAIGNRRAYGVTTLESGVHVVDVFEVRGIE